MVEEGWLSKIKSLDYFKTLADPRFIELDGLILLEAHYTPESFEQLKQILEGRTSAKDLQKAENTNNHVHLDDFVDEESIQMQAGEYLKKIWMEVLNTKFPNYEFECKVKRFETGYELVMWKRR